MIKTDTASRVPTLFAGPEAPPHPLPAQTEIRRTVHAHQPRNSGIRGKGRDGGKLRDIPLARPELGTALTTWLNHRHGWTGADQPALLLNQRGGRLSDRAARAPSSPRSGNTPASVPTPTTHSGPTSFATFATRLIRAGTDPVLVADLLGHTSLDTVVLYSRSTDHDREQALNHLTTDN